MQLIKINQFSLFKKYLKKSECSIIDLKYFVSYLLLVCLLLHKKFKVILSVLIS